MARLKLRARRSRRRSKSRRGKARRGRARGRVIKVVNYQTGSSFTPRDRLYKALPPGKRRSRSGRIYWETRKNRSDKPGKKV